MKNSQKLLQLLHEKFPLHRGRHSLTFNVDHGCLELTLILGRKILPFLVDDEDLKKDPSVVVSEIEALIDNSFKCKNCGEKIRSLVGAPEIFTHYHTESRMCASGTGTMAEWAETNFIKATPKPSEGMPVGPRLSMYELPATCLLVVIIVVLLIHGIRLY